MNTPPETTAESPDPKAIWEQIMIEAKLCRRTWGMGFPVISTRLLQKHWFQATGYKPPEHE